MEGKYKILWKGIISINFLMHNIKENQFRRDGGSNVGETCFNLLNIIKLINYKAIIKGLYH